MRIRILGSAAGGGVPQWNCRCANCEAARAGSAGVRRRTQSSVAVSADERTWFLLNVSPDVRQQILAFPPLGPPEGKRRGQSIAGCVLTDAEIDHTAGLLLLREGTRFSIFSTALVRHWLNRYLTVEPVLACFARPDWFDLPLDKPLFLTGGEAGYQPATPPHSPLYEGGEKGGNWQPAPRQEGLLVRAFEVQRHVPRFVTEEEGYATGSVIGLFFQDLKTGGKLVYAPCVGSLDEPLLSAAGEADAILIDGTFWSNVEPLRRGIGQRTALQMGHVPVSGPQGSLAWLADLPVRHRVYVHINNTNPMLNENGPEFHLVKSKGVGVGADGEMFDL